MSWTVRASTVHGGAASTCYRTARGSRGGGSEGGHWTARRGDVTRSGRGRVGEKEGERRDGEGREKGMRKGE